MLNENEKPDDQSSLNANDKKTDVNENALFLKRKRKTVQGNITRFCYQFNAVCQTSEEDNDYTLGRQSETLQELKGGITNNIEGNLRSDLGRWQAAGSEERIMNEDVRIPVYEIRLRYLKYIPIAHFILSVTSVVACYNVALSNKHVTAYLPLLSETGDASTQRIIFIIGGVFISNITALMIVIKYLILRYYLCSRKRHWRLQNTANCIIGLFSMCCLIIIVGFPASSEVATHTAVAALYFVTILMYTCLDCFLTHHVVRTNSEVSSGMRRVQMLKIFLIATELLFCFLYLILYHLAQFYWKRYHWKRPSLKRPEDRGFWLMFVACATEWMILISLAIYFVLFSVDFASFHIVMEGIPVSTDRNFTHDISHVPDPERNLVDEDASSASKESNEPKYSEQPV